MTKAEMNIVVELVRAKIRIYQARLRAEEAETEEEEEKAMQSMKNHQKRKAFIEQHLFNGFITAADIMDSYHELNKMLVDVCEDTAYPLDSDDAVREFFGDMIWTARSRGEF
ncbi:MAG: hypothetical protein IIZ09_14170 [Ruminococcus sp.]|nr:hypothetical protein [Ruminococcus sp.]